MEYLYKARIENRYMRSLFLLLYIIVITLTDTYAYGIIYQQKIQHENYSDPLWIWIFYENIPEPDSPEHVTVPRYRILQKIMEIGGMFIILYYCGIFSFTGLIISHYLMTNDLLFYIILGQTQLFELFRNGIEPYWLKNWYQSGYFIFRPFKAIYFYISGFAGLITAIVSSLIQVKMKKYQQ